MTVCETVDPGPIPGRRTTYSLKSFIPKNLRETDCTLPTHFRNTISQ